MFENPTLENPMQLNKEILKTDLPKTDLSITDLSSPIPFLSFPLTPHLWRMQRLRRRKGTEGVCYPTLEHKLFCKRETSKKGGMPYSRPQDHRSL